MAGGLGSVFNGAAGRGVPFGGSGAGGIYDTNAAANNPYNGAGVNLLTDFTNESNRIYDKTFSGLESAINGPDVAKMRSDASASATSAYDGTASSMARARSAMDTGAADGQLASEARRTSLARSISDVDAQNRAISTGRNMKKNSQNAAFDLYSSDLSQAQKAFQQVASNESGRYASYGVSNAQQNAQDQQTATSLAGMALMAFMLAP
jgi:hypothetical protein